MSIFTLNILNLPKSRVYNFSCLNYNLNFKNLIFNFTRNYAKKPVAGTGKASKTSAQAISLKPKLQPVTDAKLLTTQLCGGNILKEGQDPVLKDKSEYPDWLWDLRLSRTPPPIEELDQNTWEFWKRVNKLDRKRRSQELALKYKYHKF